MTTLPEDCIQAYFDPWWETDPEPQKFRRGSLVRAFFPYVEKEAYEIEILGRADEKQLSACELLVRPFDRNRMEDIENDDKRLSKLPVAGITLLKGEALLGVRAKRRPGLILSDSPLSIPVKYQGLIARWKKSTLLVAPYFTGTRSAAQGTGASLPQAFVDRVRRAEFPNLMWERLPIANAADASILRLDQMTALSCDSNSIKHTGKRLTRKALFLVEEWAEWWRHGELPAGPEAVLKGARDLILGTAQGSE